jgi:site-specific DNA-methyltransferase (adenine-specific)
MMLELNKIHNMTWQEGYKQIEDKTIDLIITSPPYNLGGKFHTGNTRYNKAYNLYDDKLPEEVYQEQQIEFLNACYDKLQDGGSMFYNHKPRIKDGVCTHPLSWILKSNFILKQEIIWRNGSQNFDKIRFYPFTERIYWLVKNPKTKLFNRVGLSDIWEFKNAKRHPVHKATFPIDLPLTIIQCFDEAKIILDPFVGIGTTAKAVIQYNKEFNDDKKYIGFEMDKTYCDIAYEDIKEYIIQ